MRISDWSSDVCSSDLFVDREIASHLGALETLAASDYLVDHDLASFYGQARRVMTLRSDWLNVAVTDAKTRRQVIDLRRPVGSESTPPARPNANEAETGRSSGRA